MSIRFGRSLLATVALSLSIVSMSAQAAAVFEAVQAGGEGISRALEKFGLSAAGRTQAADSLALGLKALGGDASAEKAIARISGGDAKLTAFLKKPVESVTKDDLADFVKLMNTTADRAGGSRIDRTYALCSSCVDETLSKLGVKNVLKPAEGSLRAALQKAPSGPELVNAVIKKAADRKIADLDAAAVKQLSKDNQGRLQEIWAILDNVPSERIPQDKLTSQQKLGRAILKLSTEGNSASMGTEFDHSLWVLMKEDFDGVNAEELAKALEDINAKGGSVKVRREALDSYLEERLAKTTPEGDVRATKARLCKCYGMLCR